jgi:hypothetical protein
MCTKQFLRPLPEPAPKELIERGKGTKSKSQLTKPKTQKI